MRLFVLFPFLEDIFLFDNMKAITFCGLIFQGLEVSPVIKGTAGLSEPAVARILEEYDALIDNEAKRKWIRSWAGLFQWLIMEI